MISHHILHLHHLPRKNWMRSARSEAFRRCVRWNPFGVSCSVFRLKSSVAMYSGGFGFISLLTSASAASFAPSRAPKAGAELDLRPTNRNIPHPRFFCQVDGGVGKVSERTNICNDIKASARGNSSLRPQKPTFAVDFDRTRLQEDSVWQFGFIECVPVL